MLEGLAVTGSTPSFSIGLSLSSVLTSDLSHFLFFSKRTILTVYFYLFHTLFHSFFFFFSSTFSTFKGRTVEHRVLSLRWYRCGCCGLVECNIPHDPVSAFVFVWHTQTYEPLCHASHVVSCQESLVNEANAAPASVTGPVCFFVFSNQVALQQPHRSAHIQLVQVNKALMQKCHN